MKKAKLIDGVLQNTLWNWESLQRKGFQIEEVYIPDGKGAMRPKRCVVNEKAEPITVLQWGSNYDEITLKPGEGVYVLERGNVERATKYGFFTW